MTLGIHRWKQLAALAAVGGALVAGLARTVDAAGKPGIVKARTGHTFEGEVDETSTPGFVTIKQADGKSVKLNSANIEKVTIFSTNAEEFQSRLTNLGKQDVAGRVALANWAMSKKEPDLAAQAVASIRDIDPKNADAARIEKQIAAVRPPPASQPASQPAGNQAQAGAATKPAAGPAVRTLTPEEIQLVRAREMRPGEKLRMQVPNDLRKKAVDAGLITAAEVRSLQQPELGALILRQGTPELQREVKIVTDPASLVEYRTRINKTVVSGCATAACHGGPAGGRLVLFGPAGKEETDLTNFVLLQKFEGTGGGVTRSMIDRTQPPNSLLLGFLQPPTQSKAAHPEVQGFKAVAKTVNDPTFVAVQTWIGKTLTAVAPSYDDIDLTQQPKPADPKPADPKPAKAADTKPAKAAAAR